MEPLKTSKQDKKKRLVLSLPLIKKIVEEVESGMSRKEAVVQYGMASGTLDTWMVKFGSEELRAHNKRRYSASQKRAALRALASGMNSTQAAIICGIKNPSVIRQWKSESQQENADISTNNTPIMPQKKSAESDSEEVRALKKALTESQMQNKALNTLIDVAERKCSKSTSEKSLVPSSHPNETGLSPTGDRTPVQAAWQNPPCLL